MIAKVVRIAKAGGTSIIGFKLMPSHPSAYKGMSEAEMLRRAENLERKEARKREQRVSR